MDLLRGWTAFFRNVINPFKIRGMVAEETSRPRAHARPLVKNRPLTLEERYRILENQFEVEDIFKRVARPVLDMCDEISENARGVPGARVILRELGTTDDQRSYAFMKPMSEYGWLMEQSGAGWRISRAEKIIGQGMFMRSHQDPWDVVTVWHDPGGEGMTRVRSQRFGQDLISLQEYQRRLSGELRDIFAAGTEH